MDGTNNCPQLLKLDASCSSRARYHGLVSRIVAQVKGCWVPQPDPGPVPGGPVEPIQPAKASPSLPETHSSVARSAGSHHSWFDESFYQGCVASSASDGMEVDRASCPPDQGTASPCDHNQQQRQPYLQQPRQSPQPLNKPEQMSEQDSYGSTDLPSVAGVAPTASALDRAKVASMLDALVVQQPLFMSNKYTKLADLNRGASGFVQLAQNKETYERVAIKFIPRGEHSKEVLCRELVHLSECGQHPNIVQLKEVFLTPHHLGIAMEYVDGGDLARWVQVHRIPERGLPENDARWLFQQIALAVDFCHRLGIALRDIKLDNCLIESSHGAPLVKLCDFGYSKAENLGSGCKTACGTPEYMAPEVLTEAKYKGNAADVWSLAVMLYVMVEGAFPFRLRRQRYQMQKMIGRIVNAEYKCPTHASLACQDLLAKMLRPDPEERITVSELLQHPWFLKDLPPGTQQVNDRLEQDIHARVSEQTRNEIRYVVDLCNDHAPISPRHMLAPEQAVQPATSPRRQPPPVQPWTQAHAVPHREQRPPALDHHLQGPPAHYRTQVVHAAEMHNAVNNYYYDNNCRPQHTIPHSADMQSLLGPAATPPGRTARAPSY